MLWSQNRHFSYQHLMSVQQTSINQLILKKIKTVNKMKPDSRQSLIKPLLNVFWSAPLFKLLNLISMPFLLPFDPCIFTHILYTINIVYTSHSHLNLKVIIFLNILTVMNFWQCLFTFCANAVFTMTLLLMGLSFSLC